LPQEGELGDGLDLIALVVSSAGVAVAVAQAVPAYLAARRRSPHLSRTEVLIMVRKPNGEELRIDSSLSPSEIERLLERFLE
jgi:hypothetical protein